MKYDPVITADSDVFIPLLPCSRSRRLAMVMAANVSDQDLRPLLIVELFRSLQSFLIPFFPTNFFLRLSSQRFN